MGRNRYCGDSYRSIFLPRKHWKTRTNRFNFRPHLEHCARRSRDCIFSSSGEPVKSSPDKEAVICIEKVPPVGDSQVLSMPQLRYCLSENIRLDGADRVLDKHSQPEVDRYNSMITDYNSRCGSFRYVKGTKEQASAEVERERTALLAEGAARFSKPAPAVSSQPAGPAPGNKMRGRQEPEQTGIPEGWEIMDNASPKAKRLLAMKDVIEGYYEALKKKDVDAAIRSFAAETGRKIKKSRIAAVAADTEAFRIGDIDFGTDPYPTKCSVDLFLKKYKLPEEKWVIDVDLVNELGGWKIRSISGRKVSR